MAPSAEPPTSTASPSEFAPLPLQVVRWNIAGSAGSRTLHVELFNPNQQHGLLRSGFEIALIGQDDSIIEVFGSGGLPGTRATTIYQLPPNGTYGRTEYLSSRRDPDIKALEVTVPAGNWLEWTEVAPPTVEVIGPAVRGGRGYPSVTGRVQVTGAEGPFNVVIMGFLERGSEFIIAEGDVQCLEADTPQAFQADAFIELPRARLTKVAAYVTTVPGYPGSDGLDQPPGC